MFFVLNPGRSGSRTVAETLSQSPNCECRHEPYPQLVAEATRYACGEMDPRELRRLLRQTRSETVDGRIYGETNNKLALVIPELVEAFPAARFVWLVRDGREFVCSGMQRGWYDEAEYADDAEAWKRWRLQGDRVGDMPAESWRALDRFERICWLWSFTNERIRRDLTRLRPDGYVVVRIERLGESLPRLCEFLEIEPTDFVVSRANARVTDPDVSAGSTNVVRERLEFSNWTAVERRAFEQRCGALMDEHYPGWRDEAGTWRPIEAEVHDAPRLVSIAPPRGDSPHAASGDAGSRDLLLSIRADLSELKVLRGQLRSLIRAHDSQLARSDDLHQQHLVEASRLHEQHRVGTDEIRTAHHLETTRLIDDHAREVADLRRQLEDQREGQLRLRHDLQEEQKERRALAGSESYRIGHAAILTLKAPVRLLRGLKRRVQRRLSSTRTVAPKVSAPRPAALPGKQPAPATRKQPDAQSERRRHEAVVPMGRHVTTTGPSRPVTAMFVALGLSEDELTRCVDEVVSLQIALSGFRPLFVTDSDAFGVFRRHDFMCEYLPPAGEFTERHGAGEWTEFISDRMATLTETYRPETVIVLEHAGHMEAMRRGVLNRFLCSSEA